MSIGELQVFEQRTFKGLNKDIPAERLPPEYFTQLINMQVRDRGVPETINGTTLVLDLTDDVDALKLGYFATRGEDYVFVWCDDLSIKVYKYDKGTLTAFDDWGDSTTISTEENLIEVDGEDLTMTEEVWFAEHNSEFYFGNMSDGMYRFKPGHQSVIKAGAPTDIIVEAGVQSEKDAEKDWATWRFAYDYEYKGGRSPLSRWASARLYSNKHTVNVTMDYPPAISKNRRIYASYYYDSDDDGTPDDWSNWYFVKEEADRNTLEINLDEELLATERISSDFIHNEDNVKFVSPKAKMAVRHDNMLWVGYLVESPSLVKYYDPYSPYAAEKNFFDIGEEITGMVSYGPYLVVSTPNRIWGLQAEPDRKIPLSPTHGAYSGSMAVANGILYGLNEAGVWGFDGQKFYNIPGINTVDFSGLQKETRFELWSAQQDWEQGTYQDGIGSDYIPGALTLQPNLYELSGQNLVLETQFSANPDNSNDYLGTSEHNYFAQKFQLRGDSGDVFTMTKLRLFMRAYNTDNEDGFFGYIAEADGDHADLTSELATFHGKVKGQDFYLKDFKLSEPIEITYDTDYYIVIGPECGYETKDWQVKFREYGGLADDENPHYPEGEWLEYSDDGGDNWSNFEHDAHTTILKFSILGYGTHHLQSPERWAMWDSNDKSADSDSNHFFQIFTPEVACSLSRIEIAVANKAADAGTFPVITIETVSNNEPSGSVIATASNHSADDQLIRADFGDESLSANTAYAIHVAKTSGLGYEYCQCDAGDTIAGYSDDDLSTWTVDTTNALWCKLFVSRTANLPDFKSDGIWTSQEVDIGNNNNFKKIYVNLMHPNDAGIKIEANFYDQSDAAYGGYVTLYDTTGSNTDDVLPYDIETNQDTDITKIQVKVTFELSTASYTPLVDSILATYKRNGDSGDRLHASNVKGDYWLSNEDYDSDNSEEFTYVFNKWGNWCELDKPVFDFSPIEDDICLGIMKNPTETYQNIYQLDDIDSNVWFSGDGSSGGMYTTLKTGALLYDYSIKQFRKNWLDMKGDLDESVYADITVLGIERLSSDNATTTHTKKIAMGDADNYKPYYISLPKKMSGKCIQIELTGDSVDWSLGGYVLHYWRKAIRNTVVPSSDLTNLNFLWFVSKNDRIKTFNINTGAYVASVTNPNSKHFICIDVKREYLCAGDDGGYFYVYSISETGTLTLLNTGGTDITTEIQVCIMSNIADVAYAISNLGKIYKINLSNKTNPSTTLMANVFATIGQPGAINLYDNNYLLIISTSSGSNPVLKYNLSTGNSSTFGKAKNWMDIYDKYVAINNSNDGSIDIYNIETEELHEQVALSNSSLNLIFNDVGDLFHIRYIYATQKYYIEKYNLDLDLLETVYLGVAEDSLADFNIITNRDRVYVFCYLEGETPQIIEFDKNLNLLNTNDNSEFLIRTSEDGIIATQYKHG